MASLASELQQLISVLHATPAAYRWSELTTAASTLFSVCVAFVKDTTAAHYPAAPPPTAGSHPPHDHPLPQQRLDSQWLPDQHYPPLPRPQDLQQRRTDDTLNRAYATALSERKDIANAISALRTWRYLCSPCDILRPPHPAATLMCETASATAVAYRPATFLATAAAILSMDAQALPQRVVPVFGSTLSGVLQVVPGHRTRRHLLCGIGHVALILVYPLGQCIVLYLRRSAPVWTPIPTVTILFVATPRVCRSPWSPPPTTLGLSSNHTWRHRSHLRHCVEYTDGPYTQRSAQADPLVHFCGAPHTPGGIHTTPFGIGIPGACTQPAPYHIAHFSYPPLRPCLPSSRP